jgi:hypothetical protein
VSAYVKRERDGRIGWTGPIRSASQVVRERDAWIDAGWSAEVVPSSPQVHKEVRAWVRMRRLERAQ